MSDERIQDLIDYAISSEPASFKDALNTIMLDKAGGLVDALRDEMSKSSLKAKRTDAE